jgi:exopolysaccharide production protein ExoQ
VTDTVCSALPASDKPRFLPAALWAVALVFLISIISARPITFSPGVAGLIGLAVIAVQNRGALLTGISRQFAGLIAFLVAVLAVEAYSLLWRVSEDGQSLSDVAKIGGLFFSGLVFMYLMKIVPLEKNRLGWLAVIGGVFGIALMAEQAMHFPLFKMSKDLLPSDEVNPSELNKRAAIFFLTAPALLVFARQWKDWPRYRGMAYAICLAPLLLLAGSTESQAAQLALPTMLLLWVVSRYLPKTCLIAVFIGVTFYLFAAPFVFPYAYQYVLTLVPEGQTDVWQAASVVPRLELWAFVGETIQQRWLTGYGIDCARFIPRDHWDWTYFTNILIYHPHNAVLQIWLETGIAGVMLAFLGLTGLFRTLWRIPVEGQRLALTVITGTMLFAIVSWGLWQAWWVGALFFINGLTLLAVRVLTQKDAAEI